DGIINTEDYTYICNPWPKLTYGINIGLNWKGIDVKAQFSGVYGNDVYNAYESWEYQFFSDYNTTEKIYDASFFNGNGVTSVPRIGTVPDPDTNRNWGLVSDYHVQSGSYLRLKNLQVGYNLPDNALKSMPFKSLKVFVTANNLFTITSYKGFDPEVPSRDGSILTQGLDFYSQRYPNSRIVLIGLNVKF
ncbi:MAG: TonB-dependent receptor, partial [Draconibacterium sp.]